MGLYVRMVTGDHVAIALETARLRLPPAQIQTLIFLKLLDAGHMTIYITRSERWFWHRPWPAKRLFLPPRPPSRSARSWRCMGGCSKPIGWTYALLVWGYALAWFPVNNAARVWVLDLWETVNLRPHGDLPLRETEAGAYRQGGQLKLVWHVYYTIFLSAG